MFSEFIQLRPQANRIFLYKTRHDLNTPLPSLNSFHAFELLINVALLFNFTHLKSSLFTPKVVGFLQAKLCTNQQLKTLKMFHLLFKHRLKPDNF